MSRPSGQQLAAMLADSYNEQPTMIAVCSLSLILAYIAVTLRLVARWKARARLETDDWLIAVGLFTATGFITACFFMVRYGLGLNVAVVTEEMLTLEPFVKSVISAQALYSFSIIPIKLSILFLYHRLFPSRTLYKLSIATGVIIISYTVSQAMCFILQCIPMSSLWTGIPGRCIDLNAMLTTLGVINVVTDFILVGLPIPQLWGLRLERTKRLQLIGAFLLGGVVCIFGILRSIFVGTADPTNPSRSYVQGAMWSVLEICVGIVSACLPTLRPLFRARVIKTPTGSNSASAGHHSGNGRANANNASGLARDYSGTGGRGGGAMSSLSSKVRPSSAAFYHQHHHGNRHHHLDDKRPFAKLSGGDSGSLEMEMEAVELESNPVSRPESRPQSRAIAEGPGSREASRSRSRGRMMESKGGMDRVDLSPSRSRAIMVTTDIRVS